MTHTSRISTPTVGQPRPGRSFEEQRDGETVSWHVEEVTEEVPNDGAGERGTRSLVFTSDQVMRRVREYPSDWMNLDDAALLRVSWGR